MIKIANLAIIDTGYLTITTTTGTQATRANSGSAINLKSTKINYSGGGNIDSSPIISSFSASQSNLISITNAKLKITGVMSRDNTTDMDLMDDLDDLRKTLGIKLLYYTSTTDGHRDITDSIGATDVQHLSGTTPHLHVRCTNFTTEQTGNSKILRYTLDLEVTG